MKRLLVKTGLARLPEGVELSSAPTIEATPEPPPAPCVPNVVREPVSVPTGVMPPTWGYAVSPSANTWSANAVFMTAAGYPVASLYLAKEEAASYGVGTPEPSG